MRRKRGARQAKRAQRAAFQRASLAYLRRMVEAGEALSADQRAALLAWEAANLGPASDWQLGTDDWPGWVPLIGAPPRPDAPATWGNPLRGGAA